MNDFLNRLNERFQVNIPTVLPEDTTVDAWLSHRERLKAFFQDQVYGVMPDYDKENSTATVVANHTLNTGSTRTDYEMNIPLAAGNFKFEWQLYLPASAKEPVPVLLFITRDDWTLRHVKMGTINEYFPLHMILDSGFGLATVNVSQAAEDDADHFFNSGKGIYPLLNIPKDQGNRIGALGIWAFTASRVMDALEQIPAVRAEQVAVIGLSRLGKTALVTGAFDERFQMTISINSGHGGAALSRLKTGETVKIINDAFPHWFCPNYKNYADREKDLPVDQHQLLALVAPRLLYITSSETDDWADPESEYRSAKLAATVYEKIYDLSGLIVEGDDRSATMTDAVYQDGHVAYHRRTGDHGLNRFDWRAVIAFAKKKGW